MCVFCEAPYTPRMEAWFGPEQPCACCGGRITGHWPIKAPAENLKRQTEDLVCDGCGKTLYRAV